MKMKRERYEKRLFRILTQAGYTPTQILTIPVEKLVEEHDVKVLVAHIERYLMFTSYKSLTNILDLDVLGQINAESLVHWRSRRNCFKLIKGNYVQVMGTDMHRISRGYASLGQGIEVVEKKFGSDTIRGFEHNGEMLLADKSFEEIIG